MQMRVYPFTDGPLLQTLGLAVLESASADWSSDRFVIAPDARQLASGSLQHSYHNS
jgi:hypothetical protein